MALRGTLKDFGIADIFQLIAHQTKTGVLTLKNRDSEVKVSFADGNVVKVESTTRQKKELLGHMLVRSEVLTDAQLDSALEEQRRTLRRLGDVLVSNQLVTRELLNEFTRLQATETIYRLFSWQAGTYEFEQGEVSTDQDFGDPMRAESVLMEGFRMVDEWPMIRKKITGYGMVFEVTGPLPKDDDGDDFNLDDAFGEMGDAPKKKKKSGDADIGASERKIHSLVRADRDVQKLIDLARIGEFETCKALSVLAGKGFVVVRAGTQDKKATAEPLVAGALVKTGDAAPTILWSLTGLLAVLALVAIGMFIVKSDLQLLPRGVSFATPPAVKMALVPAQRQRIVLALETLRLEEGRYPDSLSALVSAELLAPSDLRFPVGAPFVYQLTANGSYTLVTPMP